MLYSASKAVLFSFSFSFFLFSNFFLSFPPNFAFSHSPRLSFSSSPLPRGIHSSAVHSSHSTSPNAFNTFFHLPLPLPPKNCSKCLKMAKHILRLHQGVIVVVAQPPAQQEKEFRQENYCENNFKRNKEKIYQSPPPIFLQKTMGSLSLSFHLSFSSSSP